LGVYQRPPGSPQSHPPIFFFNLKQFTKSIPEAACITTVSSTYFPPPLENNSIRIYLLVLLYAHSFLRFPSLTGCTNTCACAHRLTRALSNAWICCIRTHAQKHAYVHTRTHSHTHNCRYLAKFFNVPLNALNIRQRQHRRYDFVLEYIYIYI
jgi:hypothetical protein